MKNLLLLLVMMAMFSLLPFNLHAQQPAYQLGENIEVNTIGSWDKATIIEVGAADHAGEFKVHYEGWASSYDRWISPVYFRKAKASAPSATTPQALSRQYQLNEKIQVNTIGSWDKATIIAVGTGEHEHEFKVHYDDYASNYDRWLLPVYFRKTDASATALATPTPPPAVNNSTAPSPASISASQGETSPRLGKYNIFSYGAVGNPPLYLGHIELLKGGKYRISRTKSGDYYGEGSYTFDPAASAVQWLAGPCKDNNWGGTFTVEREGKAHKIRLRSGTIATSSTINARLLPAVF